MVFNNYQNNSDNLTAAFKEQKQHCNFVYSGEEYQQLSDTEFIVNLESSQDIKQLFTALKERCSYIEKIIYFCNSDNLDVENINSLSKKVANPILKLVQALVSKNISINSLV